MSAPSWRILAARVLLRIQSVVADAYGNLWVDTGTNGRGTNPAMSHILAMRPSPIAGSWMSTRGTHSLARSACGSSLRRLPEATDLRHRLWHRQNGHEIKFMATRTDRSFER